MEPLALLRWISSLAPVRLLKDPQHSWEMWVNFIQEEYENTKKQKKIHLKYPNSPSWDSRNLLVTSSCTNHDAFSVFTNIGLCNTAGLQQVSKHTAVPSMTVSSTNIGRVPLGSGRSDRPLTTGTGAFFTTSSRVEHLWTCTRFKAVSSDRILQNHMPGSVARFSCTILRMLCSLFNTASM